MLIKIMILAAAAAAAAAATAANKTAEKKTVKKIETQAKTPEELLREQGACMDEPDAEKYGMDYMYI